MLDERMLQGAAISVLAGGTVALNAAHILRCVQKLRWYYAERMHPGHDLLFLAGSSQSYADRRLLVAVCLCIPAVLSRNLLWAVFIFALIAAAQLGLLRMKGRRRVGRFDEQLVDALRSLANSLRAGLVLPQALEVVVQNMTPPISEEFGLVLKEYHLGVQLEEGLDHTAQRLQSGSFSVVLSALHIARRSGGAIDIVLDDTANALEEIRRLEGKLRSMTSQGKMQILVMSSLPPIFMAIVYFAQPEMITVLFTTPVGRLILGAIVTGEIVGVAIMRRIILVEV